MKTVALLVLVQFLAMPSYAQEAAAPPAADVVFTSNRDGNSEIFFLAAGTKEWKNLTSHPSGDNWPVWSPDGSRIAFQSNRNGKLDVYVMDADGGNLFRLTDHEDHDYVPAWSPDGAMLSFASWRLEEGDTGRAMHHYIVNADGSGLRRLSDVSPGSSGPAVWLPGGGFVIAERSGESAARLVVLDEQGARIRVLAEEEGVFCGSPALSPDGTLVAYYADNGATSDIRVVPLAGGTPRTVLAGGKHWYPQWSPNGRWLLSTSATATDENLDILVFPAEGGDVSTLIEGKGRESEARWR